MSNGSGFINLGGLWIKDGKDGKFFSGKLGNANIFIFKNKNKKADNQPDYLMYIAEAKKKDSPPKKEAPDNFEF